MKPFAAQSLFLGAVLTALLFATPAQARQGGDFGAGIIAGEPTGLSGKLWLGNANALDFILGFSTVHDWVFVNMDYVWNEFDLFRVSRGQLLLYYGMGANVSVSRSLGLGARGVVGVEYLFPSAPLDVFFELGPGAALVPDTHIDLTAGLGMRFFF